MLAIAQIIVSILLIALILLQERSSGLSGILGGGGEGFYQTRRGLEKIIFGATAIFWRCGRFFPGIHRQADKKRNDPKRDHASSYNKRALRQRP